MKEHFPSESDSSDFDPPESDLPADGPVVIRDPRLQAEMMAKLLEHKCEHIQEVQHLIKNGDQNPRLAATFGNGDLALRYESITFKEFRNAIELFQQLKKDGL